MGVIKKEIAIGVLISLLATFCGLFLYLEYVSDSGFVNTIKVIREGGALGTAIAIAAIPNLFVFFIFLKKNQDYRARGVLIGTILITLLTFALKVL
ncbi:membrane protein [Tenacibaculum holothuriorum]|uniref:Membrane protein n=1 Tax=Tenacibaculum holothuriorum TaxID=1635173 RepID=A0A1Y2PAL3_9FLAO|nr:hypothetical protein [Tenacibaculum holothuriorum]OSY87496.1 membrane protein [Tenacibaculum holothuriorum]